MSLRSPLGRVLGSGSAKEGTDHWWGQRVSAMALLLLGLWFLFALTRLENFGYGSVVSWLAQPLDSVLMILLTMTLAWHSKLGMQVVIEDYVHGPLTKVVALLLSQFTHVFVAMAAVFALLKIALGVSS